MLRITRWPKVLACAAFCALAVTVDLGAAPQILLDAVPASDNRVSAMPSADVRDAVTLYLGPYSKPTLAVLEEALAEPRPAAAVVVYHSPQLRFEAAADQEPPVRFASRVYPQMSGLAGSETDERAIPFGNTSLLSMGPGGFGRVMFGRPGGSMADWTYATETAMSYARPHINVQMMLALEMPATAPAGDFEGAGMQPHAYLVVDHNTKVNSADLGTMTERFGIRPAPTPEDEPHTALAAGLDLGLLPTFLSQMGMNVSVVASRGHKTGNLTLALVGTTELPVDWSPRERPWNHPAGYGVEPTLAYEGAPPPQYPTSSTGGGRGQGGKSPVTPWTPITPTVPEPVTLVLLSAGAAALLARRRPRHQP
jgi:hypothetical protein